jgi:hypothetical protein
MMTTEDTEKGKTYFFDGENFLTPEQTGELCVQLMRERKAWSQCAEILANTLKIYMKSEGASVGTAALAKFYQLKEATK